MFTGLVETVGTVRTARALSQGRLFGIACPSLLDDLKPDDSVAVNGVCLTATAVTAEGFEATAVGETLERSTLSRLRPGVHVNLERALRLGDRLGGHLVQGHVDGQGHVISSQPAGTGYWLDLEIPPDLERYAVEKGSIAIHGVSLTLAQVMPGRVRVAVIPYTWTHTVLHNLNPGDAVNLEMDLIGKYVERLMGRQAPSGLTFDKLTSLGF